MSNVVKPLEYRCQACGGRVQKNYDHVGNCASGECSGTFAHVLPLAKPCALILDLMHNAVRTREE